MKKMFLSMVALAGAVMLAAPAHAVTYEFLDDVDPGQCWSNDGYAYGNTYKCAAQGQNNDTLTIKAYSDTGSGGKFAAAAIGDYDENQSDFAKWGYGVTGYNESTGSPQHSMDNNGNLDLFLLSFDSSIALTSVRAGWFNEDSDISVLAYTGLDTSKVVTDLTNSTKSNLLTTGWSLVQNKSDIGTGEVLINSGAVSSSYWIISAYSNTFGTDGWSMGNDYLKITKITGNFTCANSNDPSCLPTPPAVPEPASLALVGAALLGAFGGRRRALKAQKA